MSATKHFFDSGVIWIMPVGTAFTGLEAQDIYKLGEVQKVGFDGSFQVAEMRTAAQVSRFAVDVAHHGGSAKLSVETGDFNHALLLPSTTGAVADTTFLTGWTAYSVGGGNKPAPFFIVFEGVDTGGKYMRIYMEYAFAPGLKTDHAIGNFVMPTFEVSGYDRTHETEGTPAYRILSQN